MKKKFLFYIVIFLPYLSSCEKDNAVAPVPGPSSSPEYNVYNFPTGWTGFEMPFQPFGIATDNFDNIWIWTNDKLNKKSGAIVADYTSVVAPYLSSTSAISKVAFDNSNDIWISIRNSSVDSASSGLLFYDGTTCEAYNLYNSGLHSNDVFSVIVDPANVKWIGTSNSLVKYDGTTWTYYDSVNSPLTEFYPLIYMSGAVWITGKKSLTKFDGATFTSWDTTNSSFPSVGMRVSDKDNIGNIWFQGYNSNVLWKFDGLAFNSYPLPSSLIPMTPYANLGCLKVDVENNVWLASVARFSKFDGSVFTPYTMPSAHHYGHFSYAFPPKFYQITTTIDSTKWLLEYDFTPNHLMSFKE